MRAPPSNVAACRALRRCARDWRAALRVFARIADAPSDRVVSALFRALRPAPAAVRGEPTHHADDPKHHSHEGYPKRPRTPFAVTHSTE